MDVWLETERLLLRRFTEADLDALCELDGDPAVMRFLTGGVPTPRAVVEREILPAFLDSYAPPGFGVWAAIEKASGEFLGWLSLRPSEGRPSEAVLGYRLRRAAWGRGYATEGARALLHHGFAALGLERVVASTYEANHASRRVMEKLGMRLVRSYRLTLDDLRRAGTFDPTSAELFDGEDVEYAISRADWARGTVPPPPGRPGDRTRGAP